MSDEIDVNLTEDDDTVEISISETSSPVLIETEQGAGEVNLNLTESELPVSLSVTETTQSVTVNVSEAVAPLIRSGETGLEISVNAGLTWTSLVEYQEILESSATSIEDIILEQIEDLSGFNTSYTHDQLGASSVWTINHNLGRHPSITVVDSSGQVVVGSAKYENENQIIITFSGSFGGTAYLN